MLTRDEASSEYLYGRLGYEHRVDVDRWHTETQDFARESVDGGAAAPFAIRLSDLAPGLPTT